MLKKLALTAGLAFLLLTGVAYADSIGGPYTCPGGNCDGAMYTLSYSGAALPDSDPLHETYRITIDIDTNTYYGGGKYLADIALKVSDSVYAFALVDAPTGVANWIVESGGLNANGCSGSGSGFICAYAAATNNGGKGVAVTTGSPGTDYTFVFDITVNNGTLFVDTNEASIKARYVYENGKKAGNLLSSGITLQGPPPSVPEPATMLLLGIGLLGAVGARKYFKK